jgi:2'-5' RNA ligase
VIVENLKFNMENRMIIISLEVPEKNKIELIDNAKNFSYGYKSEKGILNSPDKIHISLYVGLCPNKELQNIRNKFFEVASLNQPFNLEYKRLNKKGKFLSYVFDTPSELQQLHEGIVQGMNLYRNNLIKEKYKDKNVLKNFSEREKELIKEFGYPYSMELFSPHITIGKFNNENDIVSILKNTKDITIQKIEITKVELIIIPKEGSQENEWQKETATLGVRK